MKKTFLKKHIKRCLFLCFFLTLLLFHSNNQISKVEVTDPKKAFVTYNCVDTDFFKRQKNVKKENFLLYLGRLKNPDVGLKKDAFEV